MAGQTSSNYGVTITFAGNTLPPIAGEAKGFAQALMGSMVKITGPGSNFAEQYYGSNVGGNFSVTQEVQTKQRPFPPTMYNLQATVTLQQDTGCTISFPVIVESVKCSRSVKTRDTWIVDAECLKNGAETIAWQGSALTYSQPTLLTSEVFDGTQKVTDPKAIKTSYTVKYFLPLGGSTDSAANAAVDTWIAGATPPRTGLKVVNATVLRLDDAAGLMIVMWGFINSADEILNPQTKINTDPRDVETTATVPVLYTTGSPPSNPTPITGLKLRSVDDTKITDTITSRVYEEAKRDTVDDLVLPRTQFTLNASNLGSEGTISAFDSTGTVPTGYVEIDRKTEHPTSDHTLTTIRYGLRTSAQGIEYDESEQSIDPNSIQTLILDAHVYATLSGPPSPSAPSGLKLAMTHLKTLNNLESRVTYEYREKDSIDEWVLGHSKSTLDPRFLQDSVETAAVFTTSSPPSTSDAPVGLDSVALKLVSQTDDQLTPGSGGKTGRQWSWGRNDSKDQMERSLRHGTMIDADPNTIDSSARVAIVAANVSPPSIPAPRRAG